MAAERLVEALHQDAGTADLVLAFVGGDHAKRTDRVARELRAGLGPGTLIAFSTAATVHNDQEHEDTPSVVAASLSLPGGSVRAVS